MRLELGIVIVIREFSRNGRPLLRLLKRIIKFSETENAEARE